MLRSHRHLRAFVKLVGCLLGEWIYRWLGVDPFGKLGVGLGGNCDCRCGILNTQRGWHTSELADINSMSFMWIYLIVLFSLVISQALS